jgi:hypothetical protein
MINNNDIRWLFGDGIVIGILLLIMLVILIFGLHDCSHQASIETEVTLQLKHCSGETDTVVTRIRGEANRIKLFNHARDLAVPELRSSTGQVIGYDICDYKIINSYRVN